MLKSIGAFWALFKSLPVGAVLFDPDSDGYIEFNDAACAQLGYSREAFARLSVGDIDALRGTAELLAVRRELTLGSPPQRFPARHRTADGRLRHVDVTLQCIEVDGRRLGYAVWHDVSDREDAVVALRAREAELARAQRIGRVGGYEIDLRSGFFGHRSPEYLELHNLPPSAATEPHEAWVQRLHPEDRERADRFFRETIAGSARDYEAEYRILTADGETRWISSVAEIERDEEGRPLRMVGAHIDVTAIRQAELALARHAAQLEEADRRKNEFLAMLGHELRNPLAPILSVIERLRGRWTDLPPEILQSLDVVQRQATHLRVLVDELLDISRVTSGKIVLTEAPVDLASAIGAAVEQTRDLVESRSQRLTLQWPTDETGTRIAVHVHGDVSRLTQVFANLLDNASKYTEPGGAIEFGLSVETGEAVVSVSDTGVGIPAEALPEVFDLFVQSGRHLARVGGGLGIGLTLVHRLVELHRGRITAFSDGPGTGSRFEVRLPLIESAQERPRSAPGLPESPAVPEMRRATSLHEATGREATTRAGAQPARSRRVLVVDDNVDAADSIGELLQLEGHEVTTLYDGGDVMHTVLAFRPDIVLLDLGMPGKDGFQVAAELRGDASLEGLTLIALTGYGLAEDLRRTRIAGFDHHLIKPIDFYELGRLIAASAPSGDGDVARKAAEDDRIFTRLRRA